MKRMNNNNYRVMSIYLIAKLIPRLLSSMSKTGFVLNARVYFEKNDSCSGLGRDKFIEIIKTIFESWIDLEKHLPSWYFQSFLFAFRLSVYLFSLNWMIHLKSEFKFKFITFINNINNQYNKKSVVENQKAPCLRLLSAISSLCGKYKHLLFRHSFDIYYKSSMVSIAGTDLV